MKHLFLLSVAIIFSLAIFAQKVEDRNVVKTNRTPIKTTLQKEKINKKVEIKFLQEKDFDGAIIGRTNYDLQSNSAVATRLINHGDGRISAVWTQDQSISPGGITRGTGYNYTTDYSSVYDWQYYSHDDNQTVENTRVGWPVLMSNGTNEFVASHIPSFSGLFGFTQTVGAAGENWTQSNIEGGPEPMLWSRGASAGDNYYVIAVDDYELQDQTTIDGVHFYKSDNAGTSWTYTDLLPNFNDYYPYGQGDVYAIDARDDYVAIVVFGGWADTRLWKSDNNGDTWTQFRINDFPVDAYSTAVGPLIDMDEDGTPDSLMTSDQTGDVIIDSEGKVHVVFSRMRVLQTTLGASSYFPGSDWILYWNEDMGEGEYDASDIESPSFVNLSVPEAVDTVAWCLDINENGYLDFALDGNGQWSFGSYESALTTQAKLGIDANDNIYLAYQTVMEGDNYIWDNGTDDPQSYRHTWLRSKNAATGEWKDMVCISNEVTNSECVFPTLARLVDDNAMIMYQGDQQPGLHIRGDGDDVTDNFLYFKAIPVSALVNISDENVTTKFNISVYPNPTTSDLTITNVKNANISIFNIVGSEIFSTESSNNELTIDMSQYPAGTYIVKVSTEYGTVTEKVMKIK